MIHFDIIRLNQPHPLVKGRFVEVSFHQVSGSHFVMELLIHMFTSFNSVKTQILFKYYDENADEFNVCFEGKSISFVKLKLSLRFLGRVSFHESVMVNVFSEPA
ncbi:hypothetical protein MS3_00000333 [Schistosoma haematobium]|uniref:Uncharacterized protein n=1 Tax=Schistosoma haematobium TaxID=6185 RepID=A0A922IVF1_SCHHA|nr:hypothetical protein MS3_00000333 [Schistosoma haematobium]KAH9586079.1 hypothetical protein MS3_00000333 [Schistosoma haematobium]